MDLFIWIIIVLIIVGLIFKGISDSDAKIKKEITERELLLKERQDNRKEIFQIISRKYEIPKNAVTFNIKKWSDYNLLRSVKGYFWRENDTLKIFSLFDYNLMYADRNNIEYEKTIFHEIKLKDIQFYFNTGDFYTETKIQGGGGGGSSMGKAIVGGALFGDAGAVVASRNKIDPITSKLIVTDTRRSVIKYIDKGIEKFIHITYDEMKSLYSLLPGKSMDEIHQSKEQRAQPITIKDKLNELEDLKYNDIITESEYLNAREKLFDNI